MGGNKKLLQREGGGGGGEGVWGASRVQNCRFYEKAQVVLQGLEVIPVIKTVRSVYEVFTLSHAYFDLQTLLIYAKYVTNPFSEFHLAFGS